MEDAEDKAKQLADLSGVKLGKPTYISEGAIYRTPSAKDVYAYEGASGLPVPTPVSPGELKITVDVQIVYAII